MTTEHLPNLLAARLTGALLSVVRLGDLPDADRLQLLDTLETAHQQFPCLNSAEWLLAFAQERQTIRRRQLTEQTLLCEYFEQEQRERRDRFRYEDGDHREERDERLPEHDYPG